MTNQNYGAQAGRSANERNGENNRGSQNNSNHRSTERDQGNAAGRNIEKNRINKQVAAAATEKNSESANRIGHHNDSDAFENKDHHAGFARKK